jgi:lipopolysaccharide assembly outer membrane protein LptD (OstA)
MFCKQLDDISMQSKIQEQTDKHKTYKKEQSCNKNCIKQITLSILWPSAKQWPLSKQIYDRVVTLGTTTIAIQSL